MLQVWASGNWKTLQHFEQGSNVDLESTHPTTPDTSFYRTQHFAAWEPWFCTQIHLFLMSWGGIIDDFEVSSGGENSIGTERLGSSTIDSLTKVHCMSSFWSFNFSSTNNILYDMNGSTCFSFAHLWNQTCMVSLVWPWFYMFTSFGCINWQW